MKLLASSSESNANNSGHASRLPGIVANTIRIARLKLLFIAAEVVKDQNRDKVKYFIHDAQDTNND